MKVWPMLESISYRSSTYNILNDLPSVILSTKLDPTLHKQVADTMSR